MRSENQQTSTRAATFGLLRQTHVSLQWQRGVQTVLRRRSDDLLYRSRSVEDELQSRADRPQKTHISW